MRQSPKTTPLAALLVLCVMTLAMIASDVHGTTMTGTANGPNGSNDSWNGVVNWTAGVPSGAGVAAIVDNGVFADVDNLATPTYGGGLTLNPGATLQIGWTSATNGPGNINALGTGQITMHTGSQIISRAGLGNYNFAQGINLVGDATIWSGISTANHHTTKTFGGGIIGAGMLTYNGVNNTWFDFNVANPAWTGGFQTADPQNQRHQVRASANGAFGTGDVFINNNATLQITAGLANTIDDGAALFVSGIGSSSLAGAKLNLLSNETVAEFWVNGVNQGFGNFDSTTHPGLITGGGILTVPVAADTRAPLPNPIGFSAVPHGVTTTSIGMSAVMGVDASGPVQYQFRRDGGFMTGWQTSLSFTDMGLAPGVSHGYEVRARDAVGNVGGWSALFSSTPIIENVMTTSAAGGNDSWNSASNWTGGVPSGSDTAIIDMGITANVTAGPPAFAGNLVLRDNATLIIRSDAGLSVIPTAPRLLTMGAGSVLIPRASNSASGFVTFGPVELLGDATIFGGQSTSGHHTTRTFAGQVVGPGELTLDGVNNNTFVFSVANTFVGLVAQSTQNQRFRINANAAGSLGLGDVTINANATLVINADDAMDDYAELFLNGVKDSGFASKLILNGDDTIGGLWVDGMAVLPGVYDAMSGLLDISNNPLITGNGVLTVTGITERPNAVIPEPATATLALVGLVGLALRRRRAAA